MEGKSRNSVPGKVVDLFSNSVNIYTELSSNKLILKYDSEYSRQVKSSINKEVEDRYWVDQKDLVNKDAFMFSSDIGGKYNIVVRYVEEEDSLNVVVQGNRARDVVEFYLHCMPKRYLKIQ